MKRVIKVLAYNPKWPEMFFETKRSLVSLLGEQATSIEHIGSTSIPGLCAKPIIDILVEVKSLSHIDSLITKFEELGFVSKGENGIAGRRYFQKGGVQRSHHLHIFEENHPHAEDHRLFRDYLKTHKQAAFNYAELKLLAAEACNNDMKKYMAIKDGFIKARLEEAKLWNKKTLSNI
ncbi:GrpB family protein [Pseudoalteromonas phenolica]|uniref:GrpB family protein n=1 Tax=Pseudoalteromonas phenolica TaxID=161398 RepID=A0A0S2K7K6_9GAMM|nr:GrpB family protein [Pseudoalteromonas phenolica]ALO44384.1 hypothetical protein PP2015_3916 [Pseudoalteromonas phenolica]MBE0357396.1 hypothetical protein [Pseudoalteromonas phenolica O-BC30]